jgi:malate synthase
MKLSKTEITVVAKKIHTALEESKKSKELLNDFEKSDIYKKYLDYLKGYENLKKLFDRDIKFYTSSIPKNSIFNIWKREIGINTAFVSTKTIEDDIVFKIAEYNNKDPQHKLTFTMEDLINSILKKYK